MDARMNVEPPLIVDIADGIATVSLNRPKTINALSEEMLAELRAAWEEIGANSDVKAVILRSTSAHFCAGHNLKEMTARRADPDGGNAYFNELFATCSTMMLSMVRMPQPVIAEVKGIATAAGCQLVASCDLAVAGAGARFATSGVNIGLFCSTPMVALTRNIAPKHALEMLLLGEFIPAQRALEFGLVNRVVPDDEVAETARSMAEIIAAKSPVPVRVGKEAFYRQATMELDEAYAFAGRTMAQNMMADDTRNGIQAFIDKRDMPDWKGE